MNVTNVTIHIGGVRAVMKSGGIVGIMEEECGAAADRCNGLVSWRTPMRSQAYRAQVDIGNFTAIGKVVMNSLGRDGKAVAYENAKHNTLLKGCGW